MTQRNIVPNPHHLTSCLPGNLLRNSEETIDVTSCEQLTNLDHGGPGSDCQAFLLQQSQELAGIQGQGHEVTHGDRLQPAGAELGAQLHQSHQNQVLLSQAQSVLPGELPSYLHSDTVLSGLSLGSQVGFDSFPSGLDPNCGYNPTSGSQLQGYGQINASTSVIGDVHGGMMNSWEKQIGEADSEAKGGAKILGILILEILTTFWSRNKFLRKKALWQRSNLNLVLCKTEIN